MTLNNAVDLLMKKEFDIHRVKKQAHPLMKKYGIDAIPLTHEKMDEWRDALRSGVSCLDKETNLILRGGVDDIWVNPKGEFIVVDYKATSKDEEITLDDEWKIQYKRQMEIYQWLLRQNGFKVSETGYFVYVNGKTDKEAFDAKLEFDVTIIPYKGDDSWIHEVIINMKKCLMSPNLPEATSNCDYCRYRESAGTSIRELYKDKTTALAKNSENLSKPPKEKKRTKNPKKDGGIQNKTIF